MLRQCFRRLILKKLSDGTVLDGTFSPTTNRLVEGVTKLPDGRCFKGKFDEALGFPLPGTQLEDDGDLYIGSFNDQWQRHGAGEAWLADGTHYKGQFEGDEIVGGVVRIPSGASEVIFEGTLRDEMFVHGTLKQHDFSYTGEFVNNQPDGKGRLTLANGGWHEGTFREGRLHGDKCTMKMDGGFLYIGEFVDGHIKRGQLYTPTYTYDGEFSEQGKAHGEGVQIYLTTTPKLTFTGIWHHGNLLRGICQDEDGKCVDWQDHHGLQEQIGKDEGATSDDIAVDRYCRAKLKEADENFKDYNKSYMEDAKLVSSQTKTDGSSGSALPSKYELGYEHGIRSSHEFQSRVQKQQHDSGSATKEQLRQRRINFDASLEDLPQREQINVNVAKMKMVDQQGAQQLVTERMEEQYQRFMKEMDGPEKAKRGLNIDSNTPWKSVTPQN